MSPSTISTLATIAQVLLIGFILVQVPDEPADPVCKKPCARGNTGAV